MGKPVLWHIPVSHYSEKVRWALAWKGVEHDRKAPVGGVHMLVALAKTRGQEKTFPVLELEGTTIGDSTAIIAALEERFPDPPLYPTDPADRERALALEEWFDEHVGPPTRLLAWHEVIRDPEALRELASGMVPAPLARFRRIAAASAGTFVKLRFRVSSEDAADAARAQVVAAFDRLEEELGGSDYLVGGRFSVADLTAASLLYPVVDPPEGPHVIKRRPEPLERFRATLADRPGYRWVEEMFRRHRR